MPAAGEEQSSPALKSTIELEKSEARQTIKRKDWPDQPPTENAQIPATLDNFEFLMEQYGIELKFNVVKKRVDIEVPGLEVGLMNKAQVLLTHLESLAIRHRMSPGNVSNYILALGGSNFYDPFADWVTSKPWDRTSRIWDICETLAVADEAVAAIRDTLVTKWLLSIVAATFKGTGFRARGVLTLQGGQGIGKTSWFARLIDDPSLRDDVIKLGHSWDGGRKDARLAAIRHRIVELGEIEGSFRKEIAGLKAFITEATDKIRPPYGRVEAEYPRSTIFGASVNDRQYLLDTTGNSRFWTLAVEKIDYGHTINMQQVFAELKVRLDRGDQWWLTAAEERALEAINDDHRVVGAIEAKIVDRLDLARIGDPKLPKLTANQVLQALEIKYPSNPQSKEANVVLRRLLGESKRSKGFNRWPIPWKKEPEPNGREYFDDEDQF